MNARVYRKVLNTADEFRQYLVEIGHPRYAITDTDGDNEFLLPNEWVFSNDPDALMQSVLKWDDHKCKFIFENPTEEYDGSWSVIGLPDYFSDAAAMINMLPADAGPENCRVRMAFFEAILRDAYSYGFFNLNSDSYSTYLHDWDLDEEKKSSPDRY